MDTQAYSDLSPEQITPMLRQYLTIKNQHPDCLLFYRMGDFYELFFEDAVLAAPILEVQLTSRDKSAEHPIPMCGVPHHALPHYLQKLVQKGFKVALCEQMENPAVAKGLVQRSVTQVITPSLIPDPDLVVDDQKNYLAAVQFAKSCYQLVFFDLLSSDLRVGTVTTFQEVVKAFFFFQPKEWVLSLAHLSLGQRSDLQKTFPHLRTSVREHDLTSQSLLEFLKQYVTEHQKETPLYFFDLPSPLYKKKALRIDPATVQSLELLKTGSQESEGSVFHFLNHTQTSMGKRLLRLWLLEPSGELSIIEDRLEKVQSLLSKPSVLSELRAVLRNFRDLERLAVKLALKLGNPRDFSLLRQCLELARDLKQVAERGDSPLLRDMFLPDDLLHFLQSALLPEVPLSIKEGQIFRDTYHPDLKDLRAHAFHSKESLLKLENEEKEKLNIPTLKIKFSKVFGYAFEISKSYLSRVPDYYVRKQTVASGERYITESLKELERRIESSQSALCILEEKLFLEVREKVLPYVPGLLTLAQQIAELDVLTCLAEVARVHHFRRPQLHEGFDLKIVKGRHPVVESLLPQGKFVPNDVYFTQDSLRAYLITGPNMGGKSTLMKQVAVICLLAHVGSFVPADEALIPLCDALYTRIGSGDNLVQGQSTFMVEMAEMARILEQATPRSLLLIDEIGRGTSTYDGLSLAWALLEHLHQKVGCKILFATHFHELTLLDQKMIGLKNFHVGVTQWEGNLIFLYQLKEGPCEKSYGVEVAKRAGIPKSVIGKAEQLLASLESQKAYQNKKQALKVATDQMVFF